MFSYLTLRQSRVVSTLLASGSGSSWTNDGSGNGTGNYGFNDDGSGNVTITLNNGKIGAFGGMNATFDVSGISASSLQAIQIYYGSPYWNNGTAVPGTQFFDGCDLVDGFVDGGVNSPWAAANGHATVANEPYFIAAVDDGAGAVSWDPTSQSGSITVSDLATASNSINTTRFETYIVATNFNNSGQDLILGSFIWGYNNSGMSSITGTQIVFSPGNCISPVAQHILSNDYTNYKLYGQ